MTNDDASPLVTPLNGGNTLYNVGMALVGGINHSGASMGMLGGVAMGSNEYGSMIDYVGKLGPLLGVYNTDQASLVQDWH
jgi:hypothetical protein